jgi:hypothetical protein
MVHKMLADEAEERPAVAVAERPTRLARISRPLRQQFPGLGAVLVSFPSYLFSLSAGYYLLLTGGVIFFHALAQPQTMPELFDLSQWGLFFTTAWRRWDAVYFLQIARLGYNHPGLPPFFPLYPLLVRIVAWPLGNHFTLAGLVVSWLCSWGTCLWFYRLAAREYGDQLARQALLFLLCCPLIFFSFAPYSEALFLLVSVGAVERARAGRFWQASALAGLALLTRSTGLLLVVPISWELLRRSQRFRLLQDHLRARAPRWLVGNDAGTPITLAELVSKPVQRFSRWALLSLALIPLALLGYMLYLNAATGDSLAFLAGEGRWHRSLTLPWETGALLLTSLRYTWDHQILLVYFSTLIDLFLVLPLTVLVLYCSIRRQLPWFGAALYQAGLAMLLLAVPVHPGAAGWQEVLLSTQRLMLPAFPTCLLLGGFGVAHPRLAWLLRLAGLAILTIYTLQFLNGAFIS